MLLMNGKNKKQKRGEHDVESDESSSTEETSCVLVGSIGKAKLLDKSKVRLAWDSGSSITCTSDMSFIESPVKLDKVDSAIGLGGKREITHMGTSKTFDGLSMKYIKDGQTPNLLSIADSLRGTESDAKRKFAIFSATGAMRFEADDKTLGMLNRLYDHADKNNLVLGTANVVNKVYYQEFIDRRSKL